MDKFYRTYTTKLQIPSRVNHTRDAEILYRLKIIQHELGDNTYNEILNFIDRKSYKDNKLTETVLSKIPEFAKIDLVERTIVTLGYIEFEGNKLPDYLKGMLSHSSFEGGVFEKRYFHPTVSKEKVFDSCMLVNSDFLDVFQNLVYRIRSRLAYVELALMWLDEVASLDIAEKTILELFRVSPAYYDCSLLREWYYHKLAEFPSSKKSPVQTLSTIILGGSFGDLTFP